MPFAHSKKSLSRDLSTVSNDSSTVSHDYEENGFFIITTRTDMYTMQENLLPLIFLALTAIAHRSLLTTHCSLLIAE